MNKIDAGFLTQWSSKGHVYGECWSHPNTDLMYVHIPKNASSWTKPNLKDFGWEFYNYHDDDMHDKTAMVVLRDPVERWISGIAEYLALYHPNFILHDLEAMDLIFDRICFDDHTERQVNFVHGLDRDQCVFFLCDKHYRQDFSVFLDEQGMPNRYHKYEYQHVSEADPMRKKFKNIFAREIQNPKYLTAVKDYFAADYELINSVKFYGTR
jgi:hypothetical protein